MGSGGLFEAFWRLSGSDEAVDRFDALRLVVGRPAMVADDRVRSRVVDLLADPESLVRVQAVEALQSGSVREARPTLEAMAVTEPNDTVQAGIAEALGHLGTEDSIPALLALFEHGDGPTRDYVIGSVAMVERSGNAELTRKLMAEEGSEEAMAAGLPALLRFGHVEDADRLRAFLSFASEEVCELALREVAFVTGSAVLSKDVAILVRDGVRAALRRFPHLPDSAELVLARLESLEA